ncbi:MAG: acyltransferase [Deltaproteobacteria bacterium]|nr:acyltransferase [Deltaproteobacteria bacterium]
MKAGFIQFSPEFGEADANIEKALSMIEKANADLIVLPELFNSGYLFISQKEVDAVAEEIPAGKTTRALCAIARRKKINIVAGIIENFQGDLYNSAVLVSPAGYVGAYRKIHLFNEENLWFKPGNTGFNVFDLGICRIGIMICFDWFFPEAARILALKGADIICHPANLVLPYCQDAMVTRCLENKVYTVTANRTGFEERSGKKYSYTGKSQITAPDARILYQADAQNDEIGVAEIDVRTARNKKINKYNDVFTDRRTDCYKKLIKTKI